MIHEPYFEPVFTEDWDEWAKVEAWRLKQLLEHGYPLHLAEQIAADSTIDLHRALEIVDRGCKPAVAASILL